MRMSGEAGRGGGGGGRGGGGTEIVEDVLVELSAGAAEIRCRAHSGYGTGRTSSGMEEGHGRKGSGGSERGKRHRRREGEDAMQTHPPPTYLRDVRVNSR
eukprot:147210-Hanusia_phi.AAC.1